MDRLRAAEVKRLYRAKLKNEEIAQKLGMGRSTVTQILRNK